jgi:hypothetical protein
LADDESVVAAVVLLLKQEGHGVCPRLVALASVTFEAFLMPEHVA